MCCATGHLGTDSWSCMTGTQGDLGLTSGSCPPSNDGESWAVQGQEMELCSVPTWKGANYMSPISTRIPLTMWSYGTETGGQVGGLGIYSQKALPVSVGSSFILALNSICT